MDYRQRNVKKQLLRTGGVINVTFIIFNKTYMRLEEKYSGDAIDQTAANTFINRGRNQSQQGKNQIQRDTLLIN